MKTKIFVQNLVLAEPGCLQFYTGVSGQIESFNYMSATGLQISATDYSVCVRADQNFCGVQYSACIDLVNSPPRSFYISTPDTASGEAPELSKVGSAKVGNIHKLKKRFLIESRQLLDRFKE